MKNPVHFSLQKDWALPMVLLVLCALGIVGLVIADVFAPSGLADPAHFYVMRGGIALLAVLCIGAGVAMVRRIAVTITEPVGHFVEIARAITQLVADRPEALMLLRGKTFVRALH